MERAHLTRRGFLAGSLALVVAACTDDDGTSSATSTAGEPGRGDATAATTAASTAAATAQTTTPPTAPELPADPFTLGIASGDPLPDSVILWTRLAPEPLTVGGGMPGEPVPVAWEVAPDEDEAFDQIVASGTTVAEPALAHTVHADVDGLDPATWYRYRFRVGPWSSPAGRTRTMPADADTPDEILVGHASCQHWEDGYYAAHRDIAESGLHLLVWLGDYIYEGAGRPGRVRSHEGGETLTLDDYRARYAQYRQDPDLQAAHASCPWLVTWDDHEVDNNYAGDRSEDPAVAPEAFLARRAAAYQAWYEHQPVRLSPPAGPDYPIRRTSRLGALATILVLDGRQYRTDQACGDRTLELSPACPEVTSPGRTMLGDEQEAWVEEELAASASTWNVLANQVVLADIRVGQAVLNYDQWDGYPEARQRLVDVIARRGRGSTVVLTGDIHLAAVADVTSADGDIVATELVGTSISSSGNLPPEAEGLASLVPHVRYTETRHRGWVRSTVTPEAWIAEYRIVVDPFLRESPIRTDATFLVYPGQPGATANED